MFSGQVINFDRLLKLFKEYLLWIYANFMQVLCEEKDLDVAILQTQMDATRFKRIKKTIQIEEFSLIVASWVIRARWREIQRFVLEFKAS